MGKAATIRIDVSYGELLDKISILEIKLAHAPHDTQRANIERELALLTDARSRSDHDEPDISETFGQLKEINQSLWFVEDDLRACERHQKFDDNFIELARSVYKLNDQRAALKRKLNHMVGSSLVEEKLYRNN